MGAWKQDKMHGCGIKLCYDDSGSAVTQAGLFVNDEFAGTSSVCDVPAAQLAAKQAVGAASLACGLEVSDCHVAIAFSCLATLSQTLYVHAVTTKGT